MKTAVIIPFRLRKGGDPLRGDNLAHVVRHWSNYDCELIVPTDGRYGDAQFNRSVAYNRGAASTDADVLIFAESDLLIDYDQVDRAVGLAADHPGLVIPFSWFMALSEDDSALVRAGEMDPVDCLASPVKGHRGSIGAINVVSRDAYDLVGGYDELCEGAWYDDDIMKIAFDVATTPTRWVEGSAYHLYHLSGGAGPHLSRADREATSRNRLRLRKYQQARTVEQVRALTTERVAP